MINPRNIRNSDPTLTNYAVTLPEPASVMEQVLPVLPVDTQSGYYNVWTGNEERTANVVDVRAPGMPAALVTRSKSSATYTALERALAYQISDEEADEVGSAAARQAAIRITRGKIVLGAELRAKTLLTTSGNFGTVVAAAAVWSNAAADIPGNIRTAIRGVELKSGLPANTIFIPDNIVPGLFTNTLLADQWTAEQLVAQRLPETFMGLRVITPRMVQNTANMAATASLSFVWDGTTVEVLHVNPNPSILEPTWGLTFRMRNFGTNGVRISDWREERLHSDFVEYARKETSAVTFTAAGAIITGAA